VYIALEHFKNENNPIKRNSLKSISNIRKQTKNKKKNLFEFHYSNFKCCRFRALNFRYFSESIYKKTQIT